MEPSYVTPAPLAMAVRVSVPTSHPHPADMDRTRDSTATGLTYIYIADHGGSAARSQVCYSAKGFGASEGNGEENRKSQTAVFMQLVRTFFSVYHPVLNNTDYGRRVRPTRRGWNPGSVTESSLLCTGVVSHHLQLVRQGGFHILDAWSAGGYGRPFCCLSRRRRLNTQS